MASRGTTADLRTHSLIFPTWLWALGIAILSATAPASADTILVLGDSLSAGYGISPAAGWVALLEKRLSAQGYEYTIVNASISGETTAGGLERLPRALQLHKPSLVVVELGANDGLRGLPVALTRTNIVKIIGLARAAGAQMLLLGMRLPPNYGPRYGAEFTRMFAGIARDEKIPLVPFFLEKVALDPRMIQEDGLHPNALAQPALLEAVWPQLKPLLQAKKRSKEAAP
jgi:acyl-CoA thioesterase-1